MIEAITETRVMVDQFPGYRGIDRDHRWVNYSQKQWAKDEVHTSGIKSFGVQLKGAFSGRTISICGKHLNRYVHQFTGDRHIRFMSRIEWAIL